MGRPGVRRAVAGIGAFDVVTVVVLGVLGQQEVWAPIGTLERSHRSGPAPALAVALLVSSVALLWRRQVPLAVVAVVSAVLSVEFLLFGASKVLAGLLPQLLAVYAAGRYGDPRRLAYAIVLTVAALAIHDWRDPQFYFAGPTLLSWSVVLGSGLVGWAFNTRARDLQEMSARALRLEEEREERAQAAVATERGRIARELHDLVGHGISLMVLQLVAAQANLERGQVDPARQRLTLLETTARSTLAEMRRLVAVMDDDQPSLSPQPGVGEICVLVEDVRTSGVPVDLEVIGPVDAPAGVGLAAYRLVQEALTNVIKHAQPNAGVRVTVVVAPDGLTVEVADSGPGPVGDLSGGRGLAGMRERVALYGGTLHVGPRPEGGFLVKACFPLEGAPA